MIAFVLMSVILIIIFALFIFCVLTMDICELIINILWNDPLVRITSVLVKIPILKETRNLYK